MLLLLCHGIFSVEFHQYQLSPRLPISEKNIQIHFISPVSSNMYGVVGTGLRMTDMNSEGQQIFTPLQQRWVMIRDQLTTYTTAK